MDRLQKIIAASGLTSRRKAEEWILQGRVKVDGQVVTELGVKPRKGALIEVDGKAIAREDKVYYVMNKPKKVLCTLNDERPNSLLISIWACCRSVLKEEKRLMEIKKSAVAGTLESSDVQIMLSAGNNGLEFELVSDVAKQFGDAIKETITDVLNTYGVTDAAVSVVDKGALDMVIRARAIAVVQRALDIVDTPNWEVL